MKVKIKIQGKERRILKEVKKRRNRRVLEEQQQKIVLDRRIIININQKSTKIKDFK